MSTRRRILQTLIGLAMLMIGVASSVYGWFEPFALLPLLALVVVIDAVFPTPEDPRIERMIEQQQRTTPEPTCAYCRHDEVELGLLGGVCPQCSLRATHRALAEAERPRMPRSKQRPKTKHRRKRRAAPPLTLTPRLTHSLRCSFCRDELANDDSVACVDCQTQLHEACWSESDGCVTLGCGAPSTYPSRARVAEPVLGRRA